MVGGLGNKLLYSEMGEGQHRRTRREPPPPPAPGVRKGLAAGLRAQGEVEEIDECQRDLLTFAQGQAPLNFVRPVHSHKLILMKAFPRSHSSVCYYTTCTPLGHPAD